MQYTKKDLGSYQLHLIKTDKYKTITIKVMFRRRIKKEEVTIRNILTSLLVQSTKKYNTKRKMNIEAQELYSSSIAFDNTRLGNYINTTISLNVLNDKYTEKGNFNKALEFLNEVLFNPDVEDGKFKEKNVDIIKTREKTELQGLKENLGAYTAVRSLESFDKNSPVSIRMIGYLEDLDSIDGKSLYEYYLDMINKDNVEISVIGNIDESEIVKEIKKYFKLRILKKQSTNISLPLKKHRARRLFAKETVDANQTNVNMICTVDKLTDYERKYVLPLYNVILGGGPDSKLFKIVREKNSLCYFISSRYKALDNILVIRTGINRKNYSKTLKLTEKVMNMMKKGKFENEDLKTAKEFFETSYDQIEENPNAVINMYLAMEYLGLDDIDTRRKMTNKVTKNEIIKVAKKIHMDTVFTLEGDKDEEKDI